MTAKNILKSFLLLTIVVFLFPIAVSAEASVVTPRSGWGADEAIYTKEDKYGEVSKINIVLLDTYSNGIREDCANWTKSLYYYFTTRLGTKDIPFSYIVCEDGSILEGNKDKEEKAFEITGGNNSINILLLNSASTTELADKSKLDTFLTELSSKFAVTSVDLFKLKIELLTSQKSVKLSLVDFDTKYKPLQTQIKEIEKKLPKTKKTYTLSVKDLVIAKTTVKPTEDIDVKFNLTNNSSFNIYSGSIFATNNDKFDTKSDFYDSATTWASLSRPILLENNEYILKTETKEINFKIKIPLKGGKLSQNFVLITKDGEKIAGTEFKVEVTSSTKEMDIIEISSTENGRLNVRDLPGGKEVIARVLPKDRFLVTKRESGWLEIETGGRKGWILGKYAKAVIE